MLYLTRALYAEFLKTKRTLAFWLALIAPAVVIGLQVLIVYDRREFYLSQVAAAPWADYAWVEYARQTLVLWGLLMLPLFVTLETALVGHWEHQAHQWKHLFALPIPRGALYAAKQICGMCLIGLSIAALVAMLVLTGLGFRLLIPGLGFEAPIPLGEMVGFAGLMFLGSWLIVAIQTWVAQRWSSFAVACGVGIAMTVAGVVVIQSGWAGFYPWTLPVLVANGFSERMQTLYGLTEGLPFGELVFGSLGGVLAALVGGWHVTRRDVL